MGFRDLGYRGYDLCIVAWALIATAIALAFPAAFPRPGDVSVPIAAVFLAWAMVVRVLGRLKVSPGAFLWIRLAVLPVVAIVLTRLVGPLAVPFRRDVLGVSFDLIPSIDPLADGLGAVAAALPDGLAVVAGVCYVLAFGAPVAVGAILARRKDEPGFERFGVAAFRALLACWMVHLFVPSWPAVPGDAIAGPALSAATAGGTAPGIGAAFAGLIDRLGGPAAGAFPAEVAALAAVAFLAARRTAPRMVGWIAGIGALGCAGGMLAGRAGLLDVVAGLAAGAGAFRLTEWTASRTSAAGKGDE